MRGGAGLAKEPTAMVRVVVRGGMGALERHFATQPHVPRAVDDTHAAAAQLGQDLVMPDVLAGRRRGRRLVGRRHVGNCALRLLAEPKQANFGDLGSTR